MHKFTLFSIIFSFIVIVVVIELVTNDYLAGYQQARYFGFGSLPTIDQSDSTQPATLSNSFIPIDDSIELMPPDEVDSTTEEEGGSELDREATQDETGLSLLSKITPELFEQAGFEEPTLEKVDFNGLIFQKLGVPEDGGEQVLKYNVFSKDDFVVGVYEALFGNKKLTGTFYDLLVKSGESVPDMQLNQTNSFGEASFYLNKSVGENERVLLVVKFGNGVYGFEYPHASHTKVKKLIELLGQK